MAEAYFTADTHFGHARIIDLCGRPYGSVEEMDEALVASHNAVVTADDDITWFLGDYALGDRRRGLGLLARMRGRKFLVTGNHDKCFTGTTDGHRHIGEYLAAGFEIVVPYARIKLPPAHLGAPGRKMWLSHFPYDGDSHGEGQDRYDTVRLRDHGEPLVHGHVHGEFTTRYSKETGAPQVNVSVDRWGYRPVPAAEVARLVEDGVAGRWSS